MLIHKGVGLLAAIMMLLAFMPSAFAAETDENARRLIENITKQASQTLSSQDMKLEERESAFHAFLKERIDFSFISPLVMGQYWSHLSDEKKNEFTGLFSDFFLKAYAPQFGGYPGSSTRIEKTRTTGAADVFVKIELLRPKRKPTSSEWRIREFGGVAKIIDLSVSGVSVVISHKKGFHRHIDRKGVDGLLTLLRIRADRLSAQS